MSEATELPFETSTREVVSHEVQGDDDLHREYVVTCPHCHTDVTVKDFSDAPTCECGFRWYVTVQAHGERPNPNES